MAVDALRDCDLVIEASRTSSCGGGGTTRLHNGAAGALLPSSGGFVRVLGLDIEGTTCTMPARRRNPTHFVGWPPA